MSLKIQRRGLVDEYKGYNFRRESMAQDCTGKLIYPHNARFESGPFGDKAVMVEEGTENLAGTDNSFEQGINDFVGQASTVIENSSEEAYLGKKSLKATSGSVSSSGIRKTIYNVSGKTITLSMMVKGVDSAIGKEVHANIYDSVSGHTSGDRTILDGTWQKIYVTKLVSENAPAVYVYWLSTELPVGAVVYADCVQLEAKPYATTFTPSARANESLTVPIEGLLSPEQGTVEMWAYVTSDMLINKLKRMFEISKTNWQGRGILLQQRGGENPAWNLTFYDDDNNAKVLTGNLSLTPIGWNHFAATWAAEKCALYINGVLTAEALAPPLPSSFLPNMYIGSMYNNSYYSNTAFAHLRLSSIARTQEQLAPLDGPPTVDEYTTLYLPFGGADGTRAAKSIVI